MSSIQKDNLVVFIVVCDLAVSQLRTILGYRWTTRSTATVGYAMSWHIQRCLLYRALSGHNNFDNTVAGSNAMDG